jgi:hypothetical protein
VPFQVRSPVASEEFRKLNFDEVELCYLSLCICIIRIYSGVPDIGGVAGGTGDEPEVEERFRPGLAYGLGHATP